MLFFIRRAGSMAGRRLHFQVEYLRVADDPLGSWTRRSQRYFGQRWQIAASFCTRHLRFRCPEPANGRANDLRSSPEG